MTTPWGRLQLHRGHARKAARRTAREALMADVLGLSPAVASDKVWTPFSLFDADDSCIANIDAAALTLVADGTAMRCGSLRSIAVDPRWRGRGLFRVLMDEALAWCDARAAGPTLLYTAEPAIYERFGFCAVPQHAFLGPAPDLLAPDLPAPTVEPPSPARLASIVARRAPVSSQATLLVGTELFMANATADEDVEIAYANSLDAVLVFEWDGDTLIVVDIAAPRIPPLAALLAALGLAPTRIKTLFPPDRLDWSGAPLVEETGLMARGVRPEAMTRPFMFPPTTEF